MDFACRGKLRGLSSSPASFSYLLANASQPQSIFIEHRGDNSLSPPRSPYLQSSLIVLYPPQAQDLLFHREISTDFDHFSPLSHRANPVSQATLTESISTKVDIREAISLVAPGKKSLPILDFSVDRSLNFEIGETLRGMWTLNFFGSIRGILVNLFWYSSHDPPVVCSRERRNVHLSIGHEVSGCNWMFTIRFASHPHLTPIIRWKNDPFAWRSKRGFTKRRGRIRWKLKLKEDSPMCESNARLIRRERDEARRERRKNDVLERWIMESGH